jgi:predicted nucleic acid-binding protein
MSWLIDTNVLLRLTDDSSPEHASASAAVVRDLRSQFPLLLETPGVLDRWFELVQRCQVVGKRVHDARLAALSLVHGVGHLLTFNTADFSQAWGVDAVHPTRLAQTTKA